jgi:hypothetical protein
MSKDANTMGTEDTTVSNVTLESIDDFLPMPGAESIVTSDEDEDAPKNVFTNKGTSDLSFLENDSDPDKGSPEATADALSELDSELEDTTSKGGRKKVDKSGMAETFGKLIEEGVLFGFEDDKPLEEYSVKDFKELIQANFEEKEKALREQTPQEFFEALPEELQYAAEYVARGGKDMKGLFRALAQVEEQRSLDPGNPDHQEAIARQYLNATNFGNGDAALIEDQVQEWIESGTISKKASQFKPKLDQMQEEVLQSKLAQQENFRLQQQAKKEAYMENIYNTLKPSEINGVKLDSKRQKFLWDELTTVKYESLTGRPTNLLGKLLEDYQFGEKPRYDLIAEALWLLADPDDYKSQIKRDIENKVTNDTVRKLKTEEGRRLASHVVNDDDEPESNSRSQRTIQRKPANIFKR